MRTRYSVAATFNSPRYTTDPAVLYESLRSMRTVTTNEIISTFSLSQDGTSTTIEDQEGDMHIGELDGNVTIYLPRNKLKQAFCFASPLPTNLAAWLMRDPLTQIQERVDGAMVTALSTLLSVGQSAIVLILDHQGIVQVPIANIDLRSEEHDDDEDNSVAENDSADSRYTPPSAEDDCPTDELEILEVVSRQAHSAHQRPSGYTLSYPLLDVIDPVIEDPQYRQLLERVVRVASRAAFPSRGSFDMSALGHSLPGNIARGYYGFESRQRYRSNNLAERNFKIGAAGELYVSISIEQRIA